MTTSDQVTSKTPSTHHPVVFSDVVVTAFTAADSDHGSATPRPPSTGAIRTVDNQRPVLRVATPSTSSARAFSRPTVSVPNTPSARTGPPRSLSYQFTPSSSPIDLRFTSLDVQQERRGLFENDFAEQPRSASQYQYIFRGALELVGSDSVDKGLIDRKGKARDTRDQEATRTPVRWLESSIDEQPTVISEEPQGTEQASEHERRISRQNTTGWVRQDGPQSKGPGRTDIQRAYSHPPPASIKHSGGFDKWGKLRALIPSVIRQSPSAPSTHVVTPPDVNIIDELITGGLSNLMLGLWFERDDKGHRRVPVLLHRLRIRISDSLHPLHAHKAVFRIECEYANGARWVIYRQLRDFVSLHTHYAISNAFSSHKDKLPEFPRTTLPYFNFLKMASGGTQTRPADLALSQREALENYLIKLIRAVMFHPSSNRLSGFLEVSALFISLAQSGGIQYKAGYLRFEMSGNNPGPGRKSTSRRDRKQSRWCTVRDNCLVILEEPGELTVLDVFLLDSDFRIVRPVRYYRKGLHLLHPEPADREFHTAERMHEVALPQETEIDCASAMESITGRMSRALNVCRRPTPTVENAEKGVNRSSPRPAHERHGSSSSGSSVASNLSPSPMLDPSTHARPLQISQPRQNVQNQNQQDRTLSESEQRARKKRSQDVSKHTFYVENSQMRLKLFARNERQMLQWITALEKAADTCQFATKNRFDSFAPIRMNVAAQWLVDGRDYMWNLARALTMAKESIYIHDWWLSPELQLRRPGKDRYRLDRVLERKAKQGVKVYVILYQEVSSRTTPTDSNYAKQKLASLHANIMIQRSPSHFQTGTFYWAHHEKLCVIDQTIAFMGGIDLCFGRWDTPQHALVDDPEVSLKTAIWPGKDYSNPRVLDFHTLHKPEEDMYDRSKVPRMPWHDVGMQIVGQPARDLARHFVERWNWLLRIKNHTRLMPFLMPPPEFRPGELETLGLTGTCEMQICRSAGPWSLGTPNRIEHSIQSAYIAAIDKSEHFVYIENQFFISSTEVNDVKIGNGIGDALVRRIIRAKQEGTPWKCCIVIPLFPGFPFPIDHSDASAIRIIVDCQNRTLFRGENSIYGRLRAEQIEPEDYIRVFSLRNWGKLRDGDVATEIVYIHAKICLVDDRLAIIGSANINERSQRGDRDSELVAVIRDTDMMEGTMAGAPFEVGRFAHTLRVRLMREHIGVDVDALADEDYVSRDEGSYYQQVQEQWDEQESPSHPVTELAHVHNQPIHDTLRTAARGITGGVQTTEHTITESLSKAFHSVAANGEAADPGLNQDGLSPRDSNASRFLDAEKPVGFVSTGIPAIGTKAQSSPALGIQGSLSTDEPEMREGQNTDLQPGVLNGHVPDKDADVGAHAAYQTSSSTSVHTDRTEDKGTVHNRSTWRRQRRFQEAKGKQSPATTAPYIDPNYFEDPISNEFWEGVWVACAEHNTEIYRKVFHAIPDDTVTTWKQYKHFAAYHERFTKTARSSSSPLPSLSGVNSEENRSNPQNESIEALHDREAKDSERSLPTTMPKSQYTQEKEPGKGRGTRGHQPFSKAEWEEMEIMLKQIRGHLVLHPTHFLEGEDEGENFLFNADKLLPLPIYN